MKLGIYINKSNNYISKNTATINKFTVIPSKSILIGKIGEALKRNHRKINLSECMIDNNMMALVPKENELFSYYLLTTIDMFWFDNNGTIPSINSNKLRNFKIPYVNKTLQKNIVEILNKKTRKIDKLISSTQQSIEELKKYKQSLITEAVTKGLDPNVEMKDSGIEWIGKIPKHWSINRIKNKFTLNKGLTITKSDLKDKGIPVINYGEIHSRYGFRFDTKIHPVKNVDEEYLIKNENSLIKKGDFIFADTSEDLDGSGNFTCYIGDTQCFAGSHTVILKPRKNINHLYFSYLFESLAFRAQIQEKVQGIKVFSITQGILKPLTLIIPTEQEQEQIVSYLDEQTSRIDKLNADKTKVIEELESYKKSLIYEYVTGKKEV
ncbi:restriction endonuclease subunit S [Metalysinibacillus jejuensis]|uniref:restriction endonuclease subunit S n=1 Tax=Metalysinibacillus jejuensis TaxID=914327 RepID=UPI00137B2DF8|nr:restriction endonuclease subunit S [Metalysinibacillus jejuensis]